MTECDPNARDVVLKVADPFATVPVPKTEWLSENVTVPDGVPVLVPPATRAVNVKALPSGPADGFAVSEVVVATCVLPLPPQATTISPKTTIEIVEMMLARFRLTGRTRNARAPNAATAPAFCQVDWLLRIVLCCGWVPALVGNTALSVRVDVEVDDPAAIVEGLNEQERPVGTGCAQESTTAAGIGPPLAVIVRSAVVEVPEGRVRFGCVKERENGGV